MRNQLLQEMAGRNLADIELGVARRANDTHRSSTNDGQHLGKHHRCHEQMERSTMADILHRIAVKHTPAQKVYDALTTIEGLAGWWTQDTSGDPSKGGTIAFRFPPGGFDMRVLETTPAEHVRWEVVDGPAEWIGTTIDWRLREDDGWTIVMFRHEGWVEPVEFMHHCSTKWATYLMSMKGLLETGTGSPAPHDVHIAYPD